MNRYILITFIILNCTSALFGAAIDVNEANARLRHAVVTGNLEELNAALTADADPNYVTQDGSSVLIDAAQRGYRTIVRALLRAGADVNYSNPSSGMTALMIAAANNRFPIVSELLNAPNIDLYQRNHNNHTALDLAQQNGHLFIAQVLEEHAAAYYGAGVGRE